MHHMFGASNINIIPSSLFNQTILDNINDIIKQIVIIINGIIKLCISIPIKPPIENEWYDSKTSLLIKVINDINELVLAPKSIGYIENIKFQFESDSEDMVEMEAKLDTGNGAKASTIGCESLNEDGDYVLAKIEGKEYKFKKHGQSKAIVGQVTEPRTTVIIPCIQIGSRKLLDVEFALVDNRKKKQKVLLNRDVMSKMAYMINPAKEHSLEDEYKNKF